MFYIEYVATLLILPPSHILPIQIENNIPISFLTCTDKIIVDIKNYITRFLLTCPYQITIDVENHVTRFRVSYTYQVAIPIENHIAGFAFSCTQQIAVTSEYDILFWGRVGFWRSWFGIYGVVLITARNQAKGNCKSKYVV